MAAFLPFSMFFIVESKKMGYSFLFYFILLSLQISLIFSSVDLYLNKNEFSRLIGLASSINYIEEGHVNNYPLQFTIPIPYNISTINFNWRRKTEYPISYSIGFIISDMKAMHAPSANIPLTGIVPLDEEVFHIILPCNGKYTAETNLIININLTLAPNNVAVLNLKRIKRCREGYADKIIEKKNFDLRRSSALSFNITVFSILTIILSLLLIFLYCCRDHKISSIETNNYSISSKLSSSKPKQVCLNMNGSSIHLYRSPSRSTTHHSSFLRSCKSIFHSTPPDIDRKLSSLEVDKKQLIIQDVIIEGSFSEIRKGYLNCSKREVMIKFLHDKVPSKEITLFIHEGLFTSMLSHKFIHSVIGVCFEDTTRPSFLYPYPNRGNLKIFLRSIKSSEEGQLRALLTHDLVLMALQITDAMVFLHEKEIIHRDLAARNCFVYQDGNKLLTVKVSDSAMSKDLFPEDYECLDGDDQSRPIKWLSLESLITKNLTAENDVWAFGVTLWELMTLGLQPYIEVVTSDMISFLENDYRLYQPVNCPDNLYQIMVCCWNTLPEERPDFFMLFHCLQKLQSTLKDFI